MAKRQDAGQAVIHPRHSQLWLVRGFLLLSVTLLAFQGGCQEEASNRQAPSVQAEPSKIAVSATVIEPEGSGSQGTQTAGAPKIVMGKSEHDFGEIGPGTAQNVRFEFKNEGATPLKIEQVRSCCGVVTKGVKAGQIYAPGQSGALEINYRASTQPGSMKRNLYIQSNDPRQPVVTMTIKARIVPRIECRPTRLKLSLKQENGDAKDITLRSLDGRPFSIKGFRATANAIRADFDPTAEATEFVLKPKVNMERVERNPRGQISIDLTHPECRNVRVLYDVLAEFTVDREQIMLFNLKAGQPVQREVWVLSNYQKEFEIESVSSQKGTTKLVDQQKVDSRYRLTFEITPPPVESDRAVMSDVIEVKIKGGTTLTIQCRGFYQGK